MARQAKQELVDSVVLFDRDQMKRTVGELAAKGGFIGASSWKYPGWRGMLYDESRYVYRGKFAETRFERNCLSECAEVFKTVCVDAGITASLTHGKSKAWCHRCRRISFSPSKSRMKSRSRSSQTSRDTDRGPGIFRSICLPQ